MSCARLKLLAAGLVGSLIAPWWTAAARAGVTNEPVSGAASMSVDATANETPEQLQARVGQLIGRLGSEQYLARQAAQEELIKIGPESLDALITAEESPDVEVSFRAQYLVRSIHIDWAAEADSPQVKQILQNYDRLPEFGRLLKIRSLTTLPGDQAWGALCRLVRFERSLELSKEAALAIICQPPSSSRDWSRRAKIIDEVLAKCARPAAEWLRAFASYATDPQGAKSRWAHLVDDELSAPDAAGQFESQREIELDVQRRLADCLASQFADRELAEKIMRRAIIASPNDRASILTLVDWFVTRQAWELIEETNKRFERAFSADPILLYTLAEARRAAGKQSVADELAKKASGLVFGGPDAHYEMAKRLSSRGLFEASEREYRQVIDATPPETKTAIRSRTELAEMLHDLQRDVEAANVARSLRNAMALDRKVLAAFEEMPFQLKPTARVHYYLACDYGRKKQSGKQVKQLEWAIEQDPSDADVLIALYETSADTVDRRSKVMSLVHTADAKFRDEIAKNSSAFEAYNEDAWLIGNTEGNYEQAIQYSQTSLRLLRDVIGAAEVVSPSEASEVERSEGGFLDTLAHCYAGNKDYESAVKYQTLAAEKDPHSQAIARALGQFKAKLAEGGKASQGQ
jgi:tetratricopeptide (TPR) repeat protein